MTGFTDPPLTIEKMRADIAAILNERPEDIGDDDNLIDLGLDSMRAMNLILLWGGSGVTLEFSEFAEHTTLAGWWSIVEKKNAGNG